ncbi:MAG: glycosyltransferase family 2 protein [Lachnospiraceae bacterium]|nr:glycosyltransferase family 2 protein [Lachnospiraceae bacterium]
MQETKVTVVIPNYNGIKYVHDCMDSLCLQSMKDFEILVVDNGSKDGSLEILQEEYPEARVIALEENTGFCHAVNLGIRESNTPYVILLNNDTMVHADFVKALVEAIEEKEDIFSVSAMMLSMQNQDIIDGAGDNYCLLGWAYARGKGRNRKDYEKKTEIFSACGGAAIYRKAVMEEIGFFDERHFAYLEDVDIGYRARIYGYRNMYEPKARVVHAGSAVSGSRYNEFKTKLASVNSGYVIAKNMPLLLLLINSPLLLAGYFVKCLFFARKKMGKLYAKGFWKGIYCGLFGEGRKQRVRFRWKHLSNYLKIEIRQFISLFGYFIKY